jgi:hypothetical protein
MWVNFSRGIIYRIPERFDEMDRYRAKQPPAAQESGAAAKPGDANTDGEEEETDENSDAGAAEGMPIRTLVPLLLLAVLSVEWLRSRMSGR